MSLLNANTGTCGSEPREAAHRDEDEYRRRFLCRWDKRCRLLLRAGAACGIFLLLLQLLLQVPPVRQLICPVEELEGVRVDQNFTR
ncbi:hypothetical protein [Paenibacillus taiwanensis]|uniref:hypothetical protein n=1 Tax=Paenibacillus taiwanensis TaxID=401638 RepID=UPI00048F91F7|nr:hypothetical protein [Paenibacillus taiwanensis]